MENIMSIINKKSSISRNTIKKYILDCSYIYDIETLKLINHSNELILDFDHYSKYKEILGIMVHIYSSDLNEKKTRIFTILETQGKNAKSI